MKNARKFYKVTAIINITATLLAIIASLIVCVVIIFFIKGGENRTEFKGVTVVFTILFTWFAPVALFFSIKLLFIALKYFKMRKNCNVFKIRKPLYLLAMGFFGLAFIGFLSSTIVIMPDKIFYFVISGFCLICCIYDIVSAIIFIKIEKNFITNGL